MGGWGIPDRSPEKPGKSGVSWSVCAPGGALNQAWAKHVVCPFEGPLDAGSTPAISIKKPRLQKPGLFISPRVHPTDIKKMPKKFTFYHLVLGGLLVGLLYFGIFSVLSLVELGRLENRVEVLRGELETVRLKNIELRRQLEGQAEADTAAVSLARHGYRRSNEVLASIEPPPLPLPKEPSRFPPWSAWLALLVTAAAALILATRTLRRRHPVRVVKEDSAEVKPPGASPPPA